MSNKILPKDSELYRRIEKVVHYIGDPVGVSGTPQAMDEYHGYITAICDRVQAGDVKELADCLEWVAFENMGLKLGREQAVEAARMMLDWKKFTNDGP